MMNEMPRMSLSLYPNPTMGQLIIDLQMEDGLNDKVKIEIVNVIGQTVLLENAEVVDGRMVYEIILSDDIAAGLLLVRVTSDGMSRTGQIVYQK